MDLGGARIPIRRSMPTISTKLRPPSLSYTWIIGGGVENDAGAEMGPAGRVREGILPRVIIR